MIALALILAYLIGSIPFGLLLTRAAGLGDVRAIGSGNIGATNVLRTGSKKLALATLALDMSKGAMAVWLARRLALGDFGLLFVPFVVTIGHCYPIWLKFKGGKGVATAFGALLVNLPAVGASALGVWLVVFAAMRISSLAALTTFWALPFIGWWIYHHNPFWPLMEIVILPVSVLITWRHRANIWRLLHGTEPRFSRK